MPAFAETLDCRLTPRVIKGATKLFWTRGDPPELSFSPGCVFYSPAKARQLAWGHAVAATVLQIKVRDGEHLLVSIFEMTDGRFHQKGTLDVSQAELVRILQFGLAESK